MNFDIRLLNCLWLMLPLLVWNFILAPRITEARITSDGYSPKWLLVTENIVRIFVFLLPLFMPLEINGFISKTGLWVYTLGTLVYFTSWLPYLCAPQSAWSNSAAGLLAPRLTPYLSFLGVAIIGQSWLYAVIAGLFVILHTWHGVQNLQKLKKSA